jgi:hypothetical protein
VDPFAIGTAVAPPLWQILKRIKGSGVISAYFDAHGKRIFGSDEIEVEDNEVADAPQGGGLWWFSIKPLEDYVFTRLAVGADAAIEQYGTVTGTPNADPRYFRWIAPVLPGRIYGGDSPPNALVEFVVIGYKPKALVREFSPD